MESKIRILIGHLENNGGIELAHVYPTSYGPPSPDRCVYTLIHWPSDAYSASTKGQVVMGTYSY